MLRKEPSARQEHLRFVACLLKGETMTALAGEFGISRKTGYKTFVSLKRDKPNCAASTIAEILVPRLDGHMRVPSKMTIHAVLDRPDLVWRQGLVRHKGRVRNQGRKRATGTPLSAAAAPNDLWCADFQGRVQARQRPLLPSPHRHRPASRFIVAQRPHQGEPGRQRPRASAHLPTSFPALFPVRSPLIPRC
jgi:hypothetical protein